MMARVFVICAFLAAGALPSAYAQNPARPEAVTRLGFLVGTFEGEARFFAPGAPAQTGRMTFRGEWDLEGAILKANYEQRMSAGSAPVSGHLIFRWRPRDSTYAFEGYANTLMEPHRLTGKWEGRLVYEGTMGAFAFREIWEQRGADTLVNAMESKQGERWVRVSENVLARRRQQD